ncbi:MAG: RNA methyltransferase [Bdellovibrionaceae bacterium]|nr:RNA methyltransferase [Pseudobdellovibrionaceae bacterium]
MHPLRVVLIRPLYSRNIGSTSRAMSNMGCEKLILIDPRCQIDFEAKQAAATGQLALENCRIYSSWQEFNSTEARQIRIGFTARDGRGRRVEFLQAALTRLKLQSPLPALDLVFGPEDSGLSNEDLEQCNFACALPTYGENPSLNLAQAVLLAAFIVRQELKETPANLKDLLEWRLGYIDEGTLKNFLQALRLDISDRRINAFTEISRLLRRAYPNEKEAKILEMVLQQAIRKMEEYNLALEDLRQRTGDPQASFFKSRPRP